MKLTLLSRCMRALLPRCVRTKVRWRLLLLTSVPIMLTLVGMIALTLYWTLTYSWQKLLPTVRSDLGVAHHAITVQQPAPAARAPRLVALRQPLRRLRRAHLDHGPQDAGSQIE